jgi:F0F1-type ATP synthase beta subunit
MRARELMRRYVAIDPDFALIGATEKQSDPDIVRAHRLLGYLRQPFLVAEPFTGQPGEWVTQHQLLDEVDAILGP